VTDLRRADISFKDWLKWVFDHPVSTPEWYWDDRDKLGDIAWREGSAATEIKFMTRLFEAPTRCLTNLSDAQANQGLWFLTGDSCMNCLAHLLDESVAWTERQHCIHSTLTLFTTYFSERCSPHLSHLSESDNPLNLSCYMWWDHLHTDSRLKEPSTATVNAEIVAVMGQTLDLSNNACRESALHGLGHWYKYRPEQVTQIVNTFVANHSDLRPELLSYARVAGVGRVL